LISDDCFSNARLLGDPKIRQQVHVPQGFPRQFLPAQQAFQSISILEMALL
jgi:hypothetical protein